MRERESVISSAVRQQVEQKQGRKVKVLLAEGFCMCVSVKTPKTEVMDRDQSDESRRGWHYPPLLNDSPKLSGPEVRPDYAP